MTIDGPVPGKAVEAAKLAQIGKLIKDNQLVTAVVVFVLWQAGALANAVSFIGGVC
jgi:hypothetical protein